jgi:hypothetical protein
MNAVGYTLALALTRQEGAAPLPVRWAWVGMLARHEPHPADVRQASHILHEAGHMAGGRLTASGVRAALEALSGATLPPGTERQVNL